MKIYIDQSNKIEQTNKDTILSLSNSIQYTILIPARTKRRLKEFFRMHGQSKSFIFKTFAAGIFLLLKYSNIKNEKIIIDMEYPGRDKQIKFFIEKMDKRTGTKFNLSFERIGKKSNAHNLAYQVANKKLSTNKIVSLREIEQTLSLKPKSRGV